MKTKLLILSLLVTISAYGQVVTLGNYHKHDSIAAYVDFLEKPHLSAKDYIIDLFDKYDFVVFVEREHPEMLQYELLMDVFADERFQEQVGHIFHEIGGNIWDKEYNDYLHKPGLSKEQSRQRALEIQRKMSWYPVWARANYHQMLTGLYEINRNLPKDKKLSLRPTDISVDWSKDINDEYIKKNVFGMQLLRDSVMAESIMKVVNADNGKRKKYFAVMNTVHGTFQKTNLMGQPYTPMLWYLKKKYPGKIANVLINMQNFRPGETNLFKVMHNGKIDAAFEYLGLDNVGFDFAGSPFAHLKDRQFNENDSITFADRYTGFVFYGALPDHIYKEGTKDLIDPPFAEELARRTMIFNEFEKIPLPGKAFDFYDEKYDYRKTTHSENLAESWTEVMKWLKKPQPKTSQFFFETHEDSLSLITLVEPITNVFINRARKAGFLPNPEVSVSMKTTPRFIYYDGNYNVHYPYWHQLDDPSKQFLMSITDDEAEAKKLFGMFFNTYYLPYEMANYLSHVSGDHSKSGSYEGALFANQLAMLYWRDFKYFDQHLKLCYEMAKKVLLKLKNPVPTGENEAEWFSKNYRQLVQSADPYTYGYFKFSQFIKVYEDEALKKQTLNGFLAEYKKATEQIKK